MEDSETKNQLENTDVSKKENDFIVDPQDETATDTVELTENMKAESTNDEHEPRKKRRRRYKTLERRFINPIAIKRRLLYNNSDMDTSNGNSNDSVADAAHSNSSEKSDKDHFLSVFNFPENWNEDQLKAFIEKEVELVNNVEMLLDKDENFIGTIQLAFNNPKQCKLAKTELMNKEVEGKRLEAYDSEDESDSDVESTEPQAKRKNKGHWRPDIDIWEKDPKGMYGLKPEYLKIMGIKPPIDRWVHVTNFQTSKHELKEVMELAGEVMVCSVVSGLQKYAKVMYSHPLEAVQAVSMLHKRQYHGAALQVVMDTTPASSTYLLPSGLLNVGPGLGSNGSPLRDIVRHYERFVKGFNSSINTVLFHEPDENMSSSVTIDANFRKLKQEIPQAITNKFVSQNVPKSIRPQPVPQWKPAPKPQFIPSAMGPQFPGQAVPTPGSRNGPTGPVFGPNSPMSGPSMPCQGRLVPRPMGPTGPAGLMPGPVGPTGPRTDDPMTALSRPMNAPSMDPVSVELSNLPLNTTFPLLSEKMGQCGPVMSVQLTAPGCAVVRFSHHTYAERCYKQYNNACVLGNIIKVRYL